ncbi:MAG TPA: TCP-1/cpn60 chaperonin family protein, partial [Gammaproteobacteria bacterium]|nr:TCP-1/cpn60 chaperonin family protein [Gammaproteobacteria bacterium]
FAAMLSQNIRAMAKQASPEIAAQVATIATNGNSQFGALVAQALEKVGPEGTITLDSSTNQTTYLEIRDGFQMNAGFLSPEFVTDREHGVAVLENPWILITERQLSQGTSKPPRLHDLGPLMNFCCGADAEGRTQVRDKRPLLILADDVLAGSDAMQLLLINHRQGNLQTCIVRAPGYGEFKRAGLSDLALATGGRVLGTDGGEALSRWVTDAKGNPSGARLGQCRRAVITRDRLVLEGCMGDPNDPEIATRYAASLREQAADATEPQTREYLLQRAARLTGSVAVLRVGAPTEEEAATLRDWAEDAVLAVRCAVREGVVAGGGMTLFALAQQLRSSAPDMQEHYKRAALILADAMEAPLRQIATNAGVDAQKVVDELLLQNAGKDETGDIIGYDAAAEVFRPMLAAGIVDPAKVVRVALEKAVSIAALMLTSSCMIYVDPKANAGQPIIHLPALPPQNMQGV